MKECNCKSKEQNDRIGKSVEKVSNTVNIMLWLGFIFGLAVTIGIIVLFVKYGLGW